MKFPVTNTNAPRVRFRLFLIPTLVGQHWYWLHPCYVRERYVCSYAGDGWDIEEVLEESFLPF